MNAFIYEPSGNQILFYFVRRVFDLLIYVTETEKDKIYMIPQNMLRMSAISSMKMKVRRILNIWKTSTIYVSYFPHDIEKKFKIFSI